MSALQRHLTNSFIGMRPFKAPSQRTDSRYNLSRKLKPTARPIDGPEDPSRLVSAADCRLVVFDSVTEATRLWIKGREFTVPRLLGDAYRDEVERYYQGALAIFRLAPQDYHRFHVPVDGKIGKMTDIDGEYYTVNVGVSVLLFFCSLWLTDGYSRRLSEVRSTYTERMHGKSSP